MHVDIDQLGVDADVDHSDRMTAALQAPLVALLERVHQGACADRPAVDREHHPVAAASTEARLADHAFDEWHADHVEHLRRDRRTIHGSDRPALVPVAIAAQRGATVDREVETDVRMEHRECADDILDRGDLGGIALQELQARRHVGEEVPHLDHHAWQQRTRTLLDDLSGPHAQLGASTRAFDIGDRGDAGERLAAKAERFDD